MLERLGKKDTDEELWECTMKDIDKKYFLGPKVCESKSKRKVAEVITWCNTWGSSQMQFFKDI